MIRRTINKVRNGRRVRLPAIGKVRVKRVETVYQKVFILHTDKGEFWIPEDTKL